MSNHNYSQYSNKHNDKLVEEEVKMVEEAVEPKVEPVMATPEVKMEPVVEAPKPKAKTATGVVSGCMKLNVRANPKSDADVLCVLDANSEMKIDMNKSTDEWYCVRTAAGVDGYCMKKFVKKN